MINIISHMTTYFAEIKTDSEGYNNYICLHEYDWGGEVFQY